MINNMSGFKYYDPKKILSSQVVSIGLYDLEDHWEQSLW